MKSVKFLFLFSLCVVLLTGCWDKVEIDDRNYVITMGIDKYEKNPDAVEEEGENRFTISVGMAELEKTGGGVADKEEKDDKKGVKLVSGNTLASAMKLSDLYSSRQTYYGQMKAVIFGEEILKDRKLFMEALDTLERDQEINMKIIILAAKGKASDCVSAVSGDNQSTGLFLWEFYKNNSKEVAVTKKLDFETLLVSLRSNGDAVMPLVGTKEKKIDLGGSALLKDYTLIGYLDEHQERGVLFMEGDGEGAVLNQKYEDVPVPLRIVKNTSKVTFEGLNENIICNVDIYVTGNVEGYTVENGTIFKNDKIKEIEAVFESAIQKEAEESIWMLQKVYKVDAMDFSGELRKKGYSIYKKHSGGNEAIFRNMKVKINANVDISGIGMIK